MDPDRIAAGYAREGVLRIPGFFAEADIQRIRRALDRYVRDIAPGVPGEDRVLEADGKSIRNLWRMQNHDPFFAALAERPEITGLVARLVQGEPVLMAVESFCKPARVGSAVPYHQDNAYFCQAPPDVVTVWVALDVVDETNGAVCYLAGSHQQGLRPHKASLVQGNSIGLAEPPDLSSMPQFTARLQPGDVVLHHCEVIHWSMPNTSDRSRQGLLLVYRGAHTSTDPRLEAEYAAARAVLDAR